MTSAHHLILGGQRSGKSRHAERLAMRWLAQSPLHSVTVVATATPSDAEMHERIARHRADRPSGFETLEAPVELGSVLREAADAHRLLIVDCLTLWLANVLMPALPAHGDGAGALAPGWPDLKADLLSALRAAPGPVLLVSNEIGLGVIPMGAEVRHFVDELGRLNQDVAQACRHITLMAAGQAFTREVEVWA
ncbi:bifunctional adenosylcobinamide kinase/adenosylcobinamide-phosphate guanylyltransferase [Aquabacterium sp.]|uniref:bifunctional adenosylcobinamide kinase/adenosylcobinamide-phosphate guanylyltransferase n=1 Tax=Aquabacterium sp. TaxID=1872578 RepID=UPI0025C4CF87|nr:bifunctional adenosylcobinamide kinase/adenosylcobinamide-phosphate guanylyltransferase [Aquabacterium sp.]